MNKVYIYSWWSGLCIEQQICKIYKETKDKVFFIMNTTERMIGNIKKD